MKPKLIYFIPAFIWLLATTVLLVIPGSDLPQDPFLEAIYFDKWVHIGLFGGLVIVTCLPFFKNHMANSKKFLTITFSVIAYGVIMEVIQKYFTKDRMFDITDIFADCFGSFLAYFLCMYYLKIKSPCRNRGRNQN